MIFKIHQYRALLAPLLTLIFILLLMASIVLPLNAKQSKYENVIDSSQPRIERMKGLLQAAPELDARLAEARILWQQQLYPAGIDDNRLNTELQTRLRNLVQKNGMTVGSIRSLPARKEHGLNILLLNISLQGKLEELQKFINAVRYPSDGNSALYVDSLSLRRANFTPNAPQSLNIEITIAALQPTPLQSAKP